MSSKCLSAEECICKIITEKLPVTADYPSANCCDQLKSKSSVRISEIKNNQFIKITRKFPICTKHVIGKNIYQSNMLSDRDFIHLLKGNQSINQTFFFTSQDITCIKNAVDYETTATLTSILYNLFSKSIAQNVLGYLFNIL